MTFWSKVLSQWILTTVFGAANMVDQPLVQSPIELEEENSLSVKRSTEAGMAVHPPEHHSHTPGTTEQALWWIKRRSGYRSAIL